MCAQATIKETAPNQDPQVQASHPTRRPYNCVYTKARVTAVPSTTNRPRAWTIGCNEGRIKTQAAPNIHQPNHLTERPPNKPWLKPRWSVDSSHRAHPETSSTHRTTLPSLLPNCFQYKFKHFIHVFTNIQANNTICCLKYSWHLCLPQTRPEW